MRRRRLVAALLVVAAIVLAGSWFGFSGRQGLTPVEPAGRDSREIDDLYLFLGVIAVVILLSVAIPLALILARYRERELPREAEGPQIRGNTRLEVTWIVIPVLIVILISIVTVWKASGLTDPASAARDADVRIRVEGRQFYFRYVYSNGVIAVDRLRIPVGRVTDLAITAPGADVVHSYWVPALGGKVDATPGEVAHLQLRPTRTGTFDGKCTELCGIQHAAMLFEVDVLPAARFDRWLEREAARQEAGNSDLGETIFTSVCSKCHFAAPEYAPTLGPRQFGDARAIRQIVRNGGPGPQGRMPAVGRGWTERELDALVAYLRTLAPTEEDNDGG